ncbi:hypothetical protein PINS_up013753 [Pythium insidiosum]|nr:hypothetical protein PINS_up013753 [Pythium insidiosum]
MTTTTSQVRQPSRHGRRARWTTAATAAAAALVFISSVRAESTVAFGATTPSNTINHSPHRARHLTIFGVDDRRIVSDASLYPYSAVGLLRWSPDKLCTASIIGSRFIVTAAECVLTATGERRPSSRAQPEFVVSIAAETRSASGTEKTVNANITRPTTANVVKVHKQSDFWKKWTRDTYAILELDTPLGDTHGKLLLPRLADLDQTTGDTPVQIVGFDDDAAKQASAPLKFSRCTCEFPQKFNGPQYMLHHNCDTTPIGSPGSPLLVRYTSMETYIIGIHSNAIGRSPTDTPEVASVQLAYSDAVANRGVLGPFIQMHLDALEKQSTDGSPSDPVPPAAPSSTSSSSSSSSLGGPSNASDAPRKTTTPPVTRPPATHRPHEELVSDAGSKAGAGSAASTERTGFDRISPPLAYACIALVACAWAAILFIVVRRVRRARRPEVVHDDDRDDI